MKKYRITFSDFITSDVDITDDQAYDLFLDYLNECVKYEDVTAFNFEEVKDV